MKVEAINLNLYKVTHLGAQHYLRLVYTITDGLELGRICGRVPEAPALGFWSRLKACRLAKRLYWAEIDRRNNEALREQAAEAMKSRGFVS